MLRGYLMLLVVSVCLGVVAVVGCERVYVPNAGLSGSHTSNPLPQVTALEGVGKDLVFGQPQVDRLPGDPMRVVIPIQARGDNDLAVQYRFLFFDESDAPLDQATGWQNMLLSAWVQRSMDGTAPNDQAKDWRLEVRPAQ